MSRVIVPSIKMFRDNETPVFGTADWIAASVPAVLTVDLSADQIRTLFSSPVTIIPAQGVGTVVVPISAVFQYKAGVAAFTNDDTLSFGVGSKPVLTSGVGPAGTIVFSALTSQVCFFAPEADNEPQSNHENGAAVLFADTQDPGGLGDGTARLTTSFYIMVLR